MLDLMSSTSDKTRWETSWFTLRSSLDAADSDQILDAKGIGTTEWQGVRG